jgi:hypothetical protein
MKRPGTELIVRSVVSWRSARLRQAVAGKLRLNWSPEQIAVYLFKPAGCLRRSC